MEGLCVNIFRMSEQGPCDKKFTTFIKLSHQDEYIDQD